MHASIQSRLQLVEQLCCKLGVQRLDLFGSAARGDFDTARSDVDLLVRLAPMAPPGYADAYFALKEGLELLFERQVDLLTDSALINPYRRARFEAERVRLYEA